MEVIIDARPFSTLKPAGVARYVASISKVLQQRGYKLIFVSNRRIYIPDVLEIEKCVVKEYTFFKYIPGTLFIMLVFPLITQRLKRSVFWGGSFAVPLFGFKSIVTIHDLVPFEYPKTTTLATLIFGRLSIKSALEKANVITAVSEFTRQRIKHIFPEVDLDQLSVIRCAVNPSVFYEITDHVLIQREISAIVKENFILAVGSIEPRKNLECLIVAFYKLKDDGYRGNLVLIGGGEWKSNHLRRIINQSRYSSSVIFTGFINDNLLNYFYNGCDLFVFPALYEGFGIPPLEALLARARVICSTNTEIPNIIKDEGLVTWFNPAKDNLFVQMKETLNKGKKDSQTINDLPSWEKSAKELSLLISELRDKV